MNIYLVAVGSSGILKGKQKLGVTFNSDKLGGIDFTKYSKVTMCRASEAWKIDSFKNQVCASEDLKIVVFENFIKSMTSCLSELKFTPSFCFANKISD